MTKVEGKGNISATIVADSISEAGHRITTFELEYPRFIHAEFMTHRQFSRNAASSRAIPIEKVIEQAENNPAMPIHWGKNQSGMQAKEELSGVQLENAIYDWERSAHAAVIGATNLKFEEVHKQIVNRILEPYQMIKVVCTATEYNNFFYLRNHADAQPEIAELARVMLEAREKSDPNLLYQGQWHLPYIEFNESYGEYASEDKFWYSCRDQILSLKNARKVSASLCAQVSYRKSDESIEKALKIYDMLVTMKPVHASPFEHQATPMRGRQVGLSGWDKGVTHQSKDGNYWSGNFKGWIQNRQLIPNHVFNGD